MIRGVKLIFTVFVVVLLAACQININEPSFERDQFKGVPLNIAVVGEIPEVREKQIHFTSLTLEELYEIDSNLFDAVFIMEDHLSQAADQKYVDMYKERKSPFFFVRSKALTIPFTMSVSYELQALAVNDTQNFISGMQYINEEQGYRGWRFPYPVRNNEFVRDDVEEIYSTVFEIIEEEFK